jgi:hypothetical protein
MVGTFLCSALEVSSIFREKYFFAPFDILTPFYSLQNPQIDIPYGTLLFFIRTADYALGTLSTVSGKLLSRTF